MKNIELLGMMFLIGLVICGIGAGVLALLDLFFQTGVGPHA